MSTEYDLENDPRDSGCLCQRCDRRYRIDFNLPDDLWRSIHGRYNLLCGRCIVELLEQRGEFDYFDLVKLDELNRPQPKRKSKKIQVEEALRRSDLTGRLAERDDVEYGDHDQLPRGEHVARLSKQGR